MKIQTAMAIVVLMTMSGAMLCTNVDFSNQLDKNGTNFAGDQAIADDDNDGIPNLYDKDSPFSKKSIPTISLIGPDTVIIPKDDPKQVLATIGATAADSVDGDPTKNYEMPKSSIHESGDVFTSQPGTYTRTYTVTNSLGKTATKSRTIIVDGFAPELKLSGANPMRLLLGTAYTEPGFEATDDIDGNVTGKVIKDGPKHVNQEGNDTVTYTVSDRAGNTASQKRIVIVYKEAVEDKVPPVITLKGTNPFYIKEKQTYVDPGCTASDDVDGDLTAKVTVTGLPVNTSVPGKDTVTYSVQDKAGNKASVQRIVVIQSNIPGKDTLPPVITFKGANPCTLSVGAQWVEPGYEANDDVDGNVTNKVVPPTNPPNTSAPGVYTLFYSVTDAAGNKGTYVRTVVVKGVSTDTEKPVIKLEGAPKCTVGVGKPFVDPGATATDNVDGVISSKITKVLKTSAGVAADFSTFTSTIGDYTITYSVSDAAGNAATPVQRSVRVKDTTTQPADVLLKKYGVPLAGALPKLSLQYNSMTLDGTGPAVSNVNKHAINWDPQNNSVYQFSLNTTDGNPFYYKDFSSSIKHTFGQPGPGFTLTGSGIAGLDGEYYINASDTQCVWVKKDGSFAIVFKP